MHNGDVLEIPSTVTSHGPNLARKLTAAMEMPQFYMDVHSSWRMVRNDRKSQSNLCITKSKDI